MEHLPHVTELVTGGRVGQNEVFKALIEAVGIEAPVPKEHFFCARHEAWRGGPRVLVCRVDHERVGQESPANPCGAIDILLVTDASTPQSAREWKALLCNVICVENVNTHARVTELDQLVIEPRDERGQDIRVDQLLVVLEEGLVTVRRQAVKALGQSVVVEQRNDFLGYSFNFTRFFTLPPSR